MRPDTKAKLEQRGVSDPARREETHRKLEERMMDRKKLEELAEQVKALSNIPIDLSNIGADRKTYDQKIEALSVAVVNQGKMLDQMYTINQALVTTVSAIQQQLIKLGVSEVMPENVNTLEERNAMAEMTAPNGDVDVS